MHVLLVGNGGREHALAWKIAQSPVLSRLTITPSGNPGIAALGTAADIAIGDIPEYCAVNNVHLVVVGPEVPLAAGLADSLAMVGVPCFGPSQAGAQLETSKSFTRALCAANDIPSPAYGQFTAAGPAKDFLRTLPAPYVIKADGLAAGKGVVMATSLAEADEAIDAMLGGQFGAASETILIEECLIGTELSFFALTDGTTVLPCGTAQDHKRAFDGDQGPNTGGMGGFSPSPLETKDLEREIVERILQPTVDALRRDGIVYRGVLYAGLFITPQGPKIIEYNCRFGDPECQMLMRRIESDLLPALYAAATGTLADAHIALSSRAAANIVLATDGYPGGYAKGSVIHGLDAAESCHADVLIFHAGTKLDGDTIIAVGGRVLNVTTLGDDLGGALDRAYAAADMINWPEGFYRRDIGVYLRDV